SPRAATNRPATATRNASGSSGAVSNVSPGRASVSSLVAPASLTQRPTPAVPRIQTNAASPPQRLGQPPALDLQIPSPTLMPSPMWSSQQGSSPAVARLSNSQTWPRRPTPTASPGVLLQGYPHSAPPTDLNANQMIAKSYPPAPRPGQLASLHRRDS